MVLQDGNGATHEHESAEHDSDLSAETTTESKPSWLMQLISRIAQRTHVHRNYPIHLVVLDKHDEQQKKLQKVQFHTPGKQHIPRPLILPHEQLHRKSSKQQIRTTFYLGLVSAFFLFPFTVSQNYMTSLHPGIGSVALILIYLSYAVGSIIAPEILHIVGMRAGVSEGGCVAMWLCL